MTSRADNFTRANTSNNIETPSDGGSAWVQQSGTWGITSNQGYTSATTGYNSCVLEASVSAVEVQVTISYASTGPNAGLVVRAADDNNFIMLRAITGTGLDLYTKIAGTLNNIGNSPVAIASGDVFKLRADSADLLTVYQNGVARISVTNSTGNTNTKHGMMSADTLGLFTAFSITDLSAAHLGFGKITSNRKYFLPSEAALVLAALESKRALSRRRFFQWLPGAFWRK